MIIFTGAQCKYVFIGYIIVCFKELAKDMLKAYGNGVTFVNSHCVILCSNQQLSPENNNKKLYSAETATTDHE